MMEFGDTTKGGERISVTYQKSLVRKLNLVLYFELFLTQVVILDKIWTLQLSRKSLPQKSMRKRNQRLESSRKLTIITITTPADYETISRKFITCAGSWKNKELEKSKNQDSGQHLSSVRRSAVHSSEHSPSRTEIWPIQLEERLYCCNDRRGGASPFGYPKQNSSVFQQWDNKASLIKWIAPFKNDSGILKLFSSIISVGLLERSPGRACLEQ